MKKSSVLKKILGVNWVEDDFFVIVYATLEAISCKRNLPVVSTTSEIMLIILEKF